MAIDQQNGTANLRASYYDGLVKGFAKAMYKFKQAVTISSTGAWKNYFFREKPDVFSDLTGNSTRGIPRGADFPVATAEWERVQSTIEKYGQQDTIYWEDIISNEINMQERTLYKVAEKVVKKVDDTIWDGLTESRSPTNIQSVSISVGYSWNATSAAIIDDLLQAKQKIAEKNYDTSNLMAFVSPKDYRSIMTYLAGRGAQFPSIGENIANNGQQGKIAGIQLVVSNSVTASYALVVVPQICGTWKELVALQTAVEEKKLGDTTIKAVEMGVLQLTDPNAVVLISNTQTAV